jgi:hypothetical protein
MKILLPILFLIGAFSVSAASALRTFIDGKWRVMLVVIKPVL